MFFSHVSGVSFSLLLLFIIVSNCLKLGSSFKIYEQDRCHNSKPSSSWTYVISSLLQNAVLKWNLTLSLAPLGSTLVIFITHSWRNWSWAGSFFARFVIDSIDRCSRSSSHMQLSYFVNVLNMVSYSCSALTVASLRTQTHNFMMQEPSNLLELLSLCCYLFSVLLPLCVYLFLLT